MIDSDDEEEEEMPTGFAAAQTNLAVTAGPDQILKVVDQDIDMGSEMMIESRLHSVSQSFIEPSVFDFTNPNNLPFPLPPLASFNVAKPQILIQIDQENWDEGTDSKR